MAIFLGGLMSAHAQTAITEGFGNNFPPDNWFSVGASNVLTTDRDTYHKARPSVSVAGENTDTYLITPMLEGEFSFWLRNYTKTYQASVKAYSCKYSDGEFELGDVIDSYTLPKTTGTTPVWQEVKFESSTATRVALLISRCYFDDFTYTPGVAKEGPSLTVKGFPNGSTYDFGDPVKEGTETTFTLLNSGSSLLTISNITVTDGFELSQVELPIELESGKSTEIVVSTPAKDAEGTLKISSDDSEVPSYIINLKSIYKVPAPEMNLEISSLDFGRVTESATKSISVSNLGDAALELTVASNSEEFVVEPSSLVVNAEESGEFSVTFNYNDSYYGNHIATLTLTPNVGEVKTIDVTAKVNDPEMWTEYFDTNEIPQGWLLTGNYWSFGDGVAKATYSSNKSYLETPSLTVSAGDEMTFDYKATSSFGVDIEIEMSKDGGEYKAYKKISGLKKMNDFLTYKISDLDAGNYRFRFKNDDYDLDNFEGFKLNLNDPKLSLSPAEDAVFGKVSETPEPKTYTVTNSGTGLLTVNIVSNSDDFSVEPASLTDIEKGESKTFTVSFNYDIDNLGDKTAEISVIPTYNTEAAVIFKASATAKNPNIWEEDFEEGILPQYWSTTGWNVVKGSFYGNNGTFMAYAGTNETVTITTPRLYASNGDELKFYVGGGTDKTDKLSVEYSHDLNTWVPLEDTPYTSGGDKSFIAPTDGYYYLRFQGKYASIDNFYGFKLAPKSHELSIEKQNLPTTGNQYLEYTASVTVKEMIGHEETAIAELKIDDETLAQSDTVVINAGESYKFTLTFIPTKAFDEAKAEIIVTYSDEMISTDAVSLTIAPAPVISENDKTDWNMGSTLPVAVFNYTAEPGWNIITTPFALTDEILTDIFGPDYLIFEFKSFGNGYMDFHEAKHFYGGYPYVVLASNLDESAEQVILKNIKIDKTEGQYDQDGGVRFHGLLSPVENGELSGYHGFVNPSYSPLMSKAPAVENPSLKEFTAEDTLPAFRGYVDLGANSGNLPKLRFYKGDGTETGIENIQFEELSPEGIYDLNGRRVKNPSQGIFIVNGKKMILR